MIIPSVIAQFLTGSLGMEEDSAGEGIVRRALQTAMRRESIDDPAVYEKLFTSSGEVRQRFIDTVVVGETWFFRDRGPFACLARHSRELRDHAPGSVLRILSAPCASGEEPYSIVMTLLTAGLPPSAFSVDGLDISVAALDKARRACYGNSSFRGNIGEDQARFFENTPDGRKVSDQVIHNVRFHHANLLDPGNLSGSGPYAVIFCRNLLIYLAAQPRRRIFALLDRILLPGGLLFAGHTETSFWQQQGYIPLPGDRAFALTKPADKPAAKTTPPQYLKPRPLKTPVAAMNPPAEACTPPGGASQGKIASAKSEDNEPVNPGTKTPVGTTGRREKIQEARCLADMGQMEGALTLCCDYEQSVGPDAEIFCLMGVIHMATHDLDAAQRYLLKALYLDPVHYESLIHLSLLCQQKGEERKAALYRDRARRHAFSGKETGKTSPPDCANEPGRNSRTWTN